MRLIAPGVWLAFSDKFPDRQFLVIEDSPGATTRRKTFDPTWPGSSTMVGSVGVD
jgi:hypothetical protein